MSIKDRAYIYASSQVLTEQFPDDVHNWDNEKIKAYCEEHAWEPFQYWDGDVIHAHIEDVKNDLIRFAQREIYFERVTA
jgi:hypothetical protein